MIWKRERSYFCFAISLLFKFYLRFLILALVCAAASGGQLAEPIFAMAAAGIAMPHIAAAGQRMARGDLEVVNLDRHGPRLRFQILGLLPQRFQNPRNALVHFWFLSKKRKFTSRRLRDFPLSLGYRLRLLFSNFRAEARKSRKERGNLPNA